MVLCRYRGPIVEGICYIAVPLHVERIFISSIRNAFRTWLYSLEKRSEHSSKPGMMQGAIIEDALPVQKERKWPQQPNV